MSTMWGSNVTELRDLADLCQRYATDLNRASAQLSSLVGNAAIWGGPAGQAFRYDWTTVRRARVAGAETSLRAMALKLRNDAAEQERVSREGGASHRSLGVASHAGRGGPDSGWFRQFQDAMRAMTPLTAGMLALSLAVEARRAVLQHFWQAVNLAGHATAVRDLTAVIRTIGAVERFGQTHLEGAGRFLSTTAEHLGAFDRVLENLSKNRGFRVLGGISSAMSLVPDATKAADNFRSGHYLTATASTLDAMSDGVLAADGAAALAEGAAILVVGAAAAPEILIVGAGVVLVAGGWQAGRFVYKNWDTVEDAGKAVGRGAVVAAQATARGAEAAAREAADAARAAGRGAQAVGEGAADAARSAGRGAEAALDAAEDAARRPVIATVDAVASAPGSLVKGLGHGASGVWHHFH